jgi:hypothetical protein
MSDEQFEDLLRKAAQGYRRPPATPRDQIWERIQAARRLRIEAGPTEVIDLAKRRTARWALAAIAAAALVLLGVAIGRISLERPQTPIAAAPSSADSTKGPGLLRFAAVATMTQVAALFTDYDADQITEDFRTTARDLLSETRLLLGSPRLTDPELKRLLEDLELLLIQVARLNRTGQDNERALIDEGMADRAIRQRLRNAIPAGPAA